MRPSVYTTDIHTYTYVCTYSYICKHFKYTYVYTQSIGMRIPNVGDFYMNTA